MLAAVIGGNDPKAMLKRRDTILRELEQVSGLTVETQEMGPKPGSKAKRHLILAGPVDALTNEIEGFEIGKTIGAGMRR